MFLTFNDISYFDVLVPLLVCSATLTEPLLK